MIVYTRNKNIIIYNYMIEQQSSQRVSEYMDLGVTFDVKLIFSRHLDDIIQRSFKIMS